MKRIKVLPTKYKGQIFRSRLEARWAVFFDTLEIKWEYEPEGFDLGNGIWYLPDFWLPTFDGGIYAEVKHEEDGFLKANKFRNVTGKTIMLCKGVPDARAYVFLTADSLYLGTPNWDSAYGENRSYGDPDGVSSDGEFYIDEEHQMNNPHYMEAVEQAKNFNF